MNKIVVPMLLAIFFSLLWIQNLANAKIKVTPPKEWEAIPANDKQGIIVWHQNSSKSAFGILKFPTDGLSSMASSPLAIVGPLMAEGFNMRGMLESKDEISFGQGNFGFRYFLNMPSPSELINSPAAAFAQPSKIAELQHLVDKG